jgi:hypothetical protein
MFIITIKVEYEQTKDDILAALNEAEENGDITDSFGVSVDEQPASPREEEDHNG